MEKIRILVGNYGLNFDARVPLEFEGEEVYREEVSLGEHPHGDAIKEKRIIYRSDAGLVLVIYHTTAFANCDDYTRVFKFTTPPVPGDEFYPIFARAGISRPLNLDEVEKI